MKHKFNAKKAEVRGRKYDSKREAAYAETLHQRREAGEVLGWCEQVPFRLPGKTTYRLDFLVFEASGECRAIEIKGMETPQWKLKHRQMQELYPWLPIEVVK